MRRLYEGACQGLIAYACSFVASFATAEDILHQVFERLLRGDLAITGAPVAYLYRAVRNTAMNKIRDRASEVDFDEGWLDSPEEWNKPQSNSSLPYGDCRNNRGSYLLHVWGQMSFEEVANALEIPPTPQHHAIDTDCRNCESSFRSSERSRHGQRR